MKRSRRMKDDELLSEIDKALDVLGLYWPPTKDEIAKAFRKKAFTTHPDRGGTHEAMTELNNASDLFEKDILADEQARKRAGSLWQQRERAERRRPGRKQAERQQREARERVAREAWERVAREERERAEREGQERERAERHRQARERVERERQERERVERQRQEKAEHDFQERQRREWEREEHQKQERERTKREGQEQAEHQREEHRERILVRLATAAGLIVLAGASYVLYPLL